MIKFYLNSEAIVDLMKSKEMQAVLSEKASQVLERCGFGYDRDLYVGRTRANAMVYARYRQAKSDNAKNNTILKALRG